MCSDLSTQEREIPPQDLISLTQMGQKGTWWDQIKTLILRIQNTTTPAEMVFPPCSYWNGRDSKKKSLLTEFAATQRSRINPNIAILSSNKNSEFLNIIPIKKHLLRLKIISHNSFKQERLQLKSFISQSSYPQSFSKNSSTDIMKIS